MELARDEVLAVRVESLIRVVGDFPRAGVRFRDLTPVVEGDPALFKAIIEAMAQPCGEHPPDHVLCIESWGFVFGAPVALRLGSRICLARRPGKLPGRTFRQDYDMSYATDRSLEIRCDAIRRGERVLIVDDVIASGGSALAAVRLIEQAEATCVGVACLAAFTDGPGTRRIEEKGIPIHAVARL